MGAAGKIVPIILTIGVALSGCSHSRGGPMPYGVQAFGTPGNPTVVPS